MAEVEKHCDKLKKNINPQTEACKQMGGNGVEGNLQTWAATSAVAGTGKKEDAAVEKDKKLSFFSLCLN